MSKSFSFLVEWGPCSKHMHGWVCEIPFIPLSLSLFIFVMPLFTTIHIDSRIGILAHHPLCLLHIVALWLIRIMCYLMSLLAHVSV